MGNKRSTKNGERIMGILVHATIFRKRENSQMGLGIYSHSSRYLLSLTSNSSTGGLHARTRQIRCEKMTFRFTYNSAGK
jgi:hypothetical protein